MRQDVHTRINGWSQVDKPHTIGEISDIYTYTDNNRTDCTTAINCTCIYELCVHMQVQALVQMHKIRLHIAGELTFKQMAGRERENEITNKQEVYNRPGYSLATACKKRQQKHKQTRCCSPAIDTSPF